MIAYTDAIKMTPEELHNHPEVEQCACAHARGLHTYGRKSRHQCKGRYTDGSVNTPCDCTEFRSTGLRMKNSLVSLPIESRADVEVNSALTQHRSILDEIDPMRSGGPTAWFLDIPDIMASIVSRHAGVLSRRVLADDLTALVNAERERCARLAEGEVFGRDGTPEGIEIARMIRGRQ